MNLTTSSLRSSLGAKVVPSIPDGPANRRLAAKVAWPAAMKPSNVLRRAFTPKALNTMEVRERDACENIICKGWDTFLEVGRALVTIRDQRLYRDRFGTFEDYCRGQWEFSKTHANRLIEAAAVAAILTPIGVKVKNESQLRPLVGLSPQKIPVAWKRAQEMAGGGQITAKVVRRAAEEFRCDCLERPERAAVPRKLGPRQPVLDSALKLIEKAEKAVNATDTQALLSILARLRKCLLD
jgi:hypothetical protein